MNRISMLALFAAGLPQFVAAQVGVPDVLERYDQVDVAGAITTDKWYVRAGAPGGGTGSVCSPFATVAQAVAAIDPTRATTIKLSGTFTTSFTIPARGVTVESWTNRATPTRARLEALPSGAPMINVLTEGNTDLPPSAIRNLDFFDAPNQIGSDIAIVIAPNNLEAIGRVEVTGCRFENMLIGIILEAPPGEEVARHVIHDNDFVWPFVQGGEADNGGTIAIYDSSRGIASTLMRANRISNYDTAIDCSAAADAVSQPRVQSNAIQRARVGVRLNNVDGDLRSNTIAFGARSTTAANVAGVSTNGGTLALFNTILWNPTTAGAIVADLVGFGTTVTQGSNLFFATPGGLTPTFPAGTQPDFVGGNSVTGVFPPVSLALLPTSAMVDAGDNAETADLTTATPARLGSLGISRVDVAQDFEQGPRIFNLNTDVGCDELAAATEQGTVFPIRIAPATPLGTGPFWDADGMMTPDISGPPAWGITLDVLGPPNSLVVVFEGWTYFDQLAVAGVPVDNGSINMHTVSPFGNLFWNGTGGWHVQQAAAVAVTDAAGVGQVTVPWSGLGANNIESAVTLQVTLLDAAGGLHNTNKVRVDFGNLCGTGL